MFSGKLSNAPSKWLIVSLCERGKLTQAAPIRGSGMVRNRLLRSWLAGTALVVRAPQQVH
jgi:hypothetical protein